MGSIFGDHPGIDPSQLAAGSRQIHSAIQSYSLLGWSAGAQNSPSILGRLKFAQENKLLSHRDHQLPNCHHGFQAFQSYQMATISPG